MKYLFTLVILPFILFTDALYTDAFTQNSTYQELLERSDRPNIYSSHLVLPGVGENALFMINFRMDYDLLPFRRSRASQNRPDDDAEFFATARVNMEIFRENNPVTRDSWSDTTWTATYEQTRSRVHHLEGALSTHLDPGEYRLMLDLNRDGGQSLRSPEPGNRRTRGNDTPSRERLFEVPDFESLNEGTMAILESSGETEDQFTLKLMNFGESALYGQNFQLLVLLPESSERDRYQLKIERVRSGSNSDTEGEPVFEQTIERSDFLYTDGFMQTPNQKTPELTFQVQDEGFPVLITEIPNSQFPNQRFRLTLTAEDEEQPVASTVVSSRWIDMPVSLLNLDVAIDMLRFIVDDSTIRQMRRGSSTEKERRFREFWAERDPTPDTEFNELMTEYYSRIDYAYNTYTTPERPGFDSDQGRAYILYGQPDRKERQYPANAPTREVWEYGNRTLVFEATSGFGDFRLVQQN